MKKLSCLIMLGIAVAVNSTYADVSLERQERIKKVFEMVDDFKKGDPLLKAIKERKVNKVSDEVNKVKLYEECTFWVSPRLKVNTKNFYLLYAMFFTLLDNSPKDKENSLKIVHLLLQKKPNLNFKNKLIIKLDEKEYFSNVSFLHFTVLFELYPEILDMLLSHGAKLNDVHAKDCKCNGIAQGINEYYNSWTIYAARIYARYSGLERFDKLHDFACTHMSLDEFAKNLNSTQYLPVIKKYMSKM